MKHASRTRAQGIKCNPIDAGVIEDSFRDNRVGGGHRHVLREGVLLQSSAVSKCNAGPRIVA